MTLDGATDAGFDDALRDLAGIVLEGRGFDSVLDLICRRAKEVIPGTDDASISLVRADRIETAAFTAEWVAQADFAQYGADQGPCLEAIRINRPVHVPSLEEDERWPGYRPGGLRTGARSSFSVPLKPEPARDPLGALNLYARRNSAFDDDYGRDLGRRFADHAAVVLVNALGFKTRDELAAQLQEALRTRETIGKAIGILMAQEGSTDGEAFAMLRTASQNSNLKLRDIAVELVEKVRDAAKSRAEQG